MKFRRFVASATAVLAVPAVSAQTAVPVDRHAIAPTVSKEAAAQLRTIYAIIGRQPAPKKPLSIADWDRNNAQTEALIGPLVKSVADRVGVAVRADTVGGVPVLRIRPPNYRHSGRTLLYVHGGGYVLFSARSSLVVPALTAAASGDEVISIDYTLAPRGTWRTVTDQVLAVWKGLLAKGVKPGETGLFGDSAGGGLAAGAVLKMRDQGLPLPGALWLLSPWSDITATGDTYTTLAVADRTLDEVTLAWGAEAYAPVQDQKNPYVSPVYGDYSKPFPATLIQVGTREIFLSNAVREYQAIRGGSHEAVLDVYEGMPHVFQALAPSSPETRTAVARATAFFAKHLGGGK